MAQTLDNLTFQWNNVATTFTGIRYDVQDTASAAGSLLMDLRTSNTSRFSVAKNGAASVHSVAVSNINGIDGPAEWRLRVSGNIAATLFSNTMSLPSAGKLAWNGGSPDLELARDEANILAQRRGTNAQTFRIYNTFTDASNYERGKIEWASNVLRIGTEKLGSGTARALEFQTDGTTRLTISDTGAVTLNTTNSTLAFSTVGRFIGTTGAIRIQPADGTTSRFLFGTGTAPDLRIASDGSFGFSSSTDANASPNDLVISRDAADTLAQRRGTAAQESRIYGSFTNATNFQRLSVKTLRESSGALSGATYVTTIAIPAYAHLVGVTTRVTTEITGATTYDVGDGSDVDLWGAAIAVAAGSQSRTADFTAVAAVGPAAASRTVTLTANGSNFTGGVVEICLHYLTTEAD
jgi:hypothetical protein